MQTSTIAPSDLKQVRELYDQGLCLKAYQRAETLGPLWSWIGPEALILAGRLAGNLGAPRLCCWLHLRAWRQDRNHPEACYYFSRTLLERRGPLDCWRFLRQQGDLSRAPAEIRSDWLALHAFVLSLWRDFEAAEAWMARAEEICPHRPWICLERAVLMEREDRYEEALASSRRALELRPWYRPGVQAVAHHLQLLGHDREALDLLTEAVERMESGPVLQQLATLQNELGHHADARQTFARYREFSPLLEKEGVTWLAARRSDAAYFCKDTQEAVAFAREAGGPLYEAFAANLCDPSFESRRVILEVGFVRQHYQTCVPAILTTLSSYWNMPSDHLEVAAGICYDGTPDYRERAWAEEHGFAVCEFTVTWDCARALIDRGIPFTLTTIEPGNAHMQAVIGYDTCRRSLIVRDPGVRQFVEFHADGLLERNRSTGPRGMALVPQTEAQRLEGLQLPDADLFDQLYRLKRALERHQREEAAAAYAALRGVEPNHRLTWQAQRALGNYDGNPTEVLASVEGILGLFPDDELHLLGRLVCLRDLGRRDERLALLEQICARPGSSPVFWQQYAQELLPDARAHALAIRWLRRALHWRPCDEGNLSTLAQLLWTQGRFEEALELYGFAACLDDKNEALARDYFQAARHLKRTEETLRFLRQRMERLGRSSSWPVRTLCWALSCFERTPEALAVLDTTLKLRPEDGELMLFAAERQAENGAHARAAELLRAAEGRAPRRAWLRAAAGLAGTQGDLPGALALWQQVIEVEPLALDAHRSLAQLLAETAGRSATLAHLEQACTRFPHNYPLHQLWSAWVREDGPAAQEAVVRLIIAIHPADAWARRELALVLKDQDRLEEAFAELEAAFRLEPQSTFYGSVRGQVLERAGRRKEARDAYRDAVRLSVDNDFALGRLMETCESRLERQETLTFIESELVRQVIFGDGLLAFQQYASYTLEPKELLASLRRALEARPDLWHAWSATIVQLLHMDQPDEAHALATQATERFPLLPGLWLDLAAACQAGGDETGEIDALRQAVQMRPSWVVPLHRLAEAYLRTQQFSEARRVLEEAIQRAPLDALSHGGLARTLWRMDEKEAALERVQKALLLEPGYVWAWGALREWSQSLGRQEVARDFSRQLTQSRPDEARSWLNLAQTLGDGAEDREERLKALDRALALNPRCEEAQDLKAQVLAEAGRFDEAEAACRQPARDGQPPLVLRGRLAWLEGQRGRPEAAIAQMRAVLKDDPDYYWGWYTLVDWIRDRGSVADYLEVGENLVRLTPDRETSYGIRGEARWRNGDRAGSKEDFRRALELAPGYTFAGLYLFDLYMEDAELDEAGRILELLQKEEDDYVRARAVQLAARRGQHQKAFAILRQLAESSGEDPWPLEAAVKALVREDLSSETEKLLEEALEAPKVAPEAARQWVGLHLARGDWKNGDRYVALLDRGVIGRRALTAYLRELAEKRRTRLLRRLVKRHQKRLRSDTYVWGMVGYALAAVEDGPGTILWLSDWPERSDLEPWMLLNLVLALRGQGDDSRAAEASRAALGLKQDSSQLCHGVWLALDDALAGDPAEAGQRLKDANWTGCDATHRFLHALVEALVSVQLVPAAERHRLFAETRTKLRQAAIDCSPLREDRPAVRQAYRRALRRLARDFGGKKARLWSLWRCWRPILPAS